MPVFVNAKHSVHLKHYWIPPFPSHFRRTSRPFDIQVVFKRFQQVKYFNFMVRELNKSAYVLPKHSWTKLKPFRHNPMVRDITRHVKNSIHWVWVKNYKQITLKLTLFPKN